MRRTIGIQMNLSVLVVNVCILSLSLRLLELLQQVELLSGKKIDHVLSIVHFSRACDCERLSSYALR